MESLAKITQLLPGGDARADVRAHPLGGSLMVAQNPQMWLLLGNSATVKTARKTPPSHLELPLEDPS